MMTMIGRRDRLRPRLQLQLLLPDRGVRLIRARMADFVFSSIAIASLVLAASFITAFIATSVNYITFSHYYLLNFQLIEYNSKLYLIIFNS